MEAHVKSCIMVGLLAAAMLPGCQRSQPPADDAEPTQASTETPAAAPAAPRLAPREPSRGPDTLTPKRDTTPVDTRITDVRLSDEGDTEKNTLGMPTTQFDATDSVYAEILTDGSAGEYTIYAKWIGADGNVLSDYGIRVTEAGPTRTIISLSKPDGWASGKNRIELAINGEVERTVTFEVP